MSFKKFLGPRAGAGTAVPGNLLGLTSLTWAMGICFGRVAWKKTHRRVMSWRNRELEGSHNHVYCDCGITEEYPVPGKAVGPLHAHLIVLKTR